MDKIIKVWYKHRDVTGTYEEEHCSHLLVEIPDTLSVESINDDGTLNDFSCLSHLESEKVIGNGLRKIIRAKIIYINKM